MLCQECKKNPATVHMTKIVNGEKTELHLCSECAQDHQELAFSMNFEPDFSIHKYLAGLLGAAATPPETVVAPECPDCGFSFAQFGELGKFGCSSCYDTFDQELEPLIRRIQGATQHTGKIPKRAGGMLGVKREIEGLQAQLQQAVRDEAYEKAAELRDSIRDLETKLQ